MSAKPVILTRKAAFVLGALIPFLKPKLAQDAKLDFSPALAGVTAKNFKSKRSDIVAALKAQTKGKLAKDANIDDVKDLLEILDDHEPLERGTADAMETDPNSGLPAAATTIMPGAEHDDVRAYLKSKNMADDDISHVLGLVKPKAADAAEETDEEKKKREEEDRKKKDNPFEGAKDSTMVSKPAMDAAIATAVKLAQDEAAKTQKEIRDAERAVRPYVGELAMANDSAEAVYRTALGVLNVKVDGVHASALPTILAMQPLPNARQATVPRVAMDAASEKGFADRFPGSDRIKAA